MQDEAGAKKGVNSALEQHWEKIAVGIVAAAFLIYIVASLSGGGNDAAKKVDRTLAAFNSKKNSPNPSLGSPTVPPQNLIPDPAAAYSPPKWTINMPTIYIGVPKDPPKLAEATFFIPNLTLNAPTATVDGVEINWSVSGEPDPNNKKVIVLQNLFYRIERRTKGDSEWKLLVKELKDSTQYKDEETSPKTDYEYRVTLGAVDPPWIAKVPGGLTTEVEGPVVARTPGIWTFEFSNITPGDDLALPKPILPTVYVKITKYDSEAGKVEWKRIHTEGDSLGFGEGTFVHTVPSQKRPGKMEQVDFNCGGKIEKIEVDKSIPYVYKACDPKPGPGGGLVCEGPQAKKGEYKVNRITYTDEEGRHQTAERNVGAGPRPDNLCSDHGGAVPRELTPEERTAAREKQAETLLKEADELWGSPKPADRRKAQEKYKQLIKTYGETEAVKPRKDMIEERVATKIEK